MPRFVLLHHHSIPKEANSADHWDFMLEHQGCLLTWACSEFPTSNAEMECERLADHRLAYLDYEGPVSNQRGQVTRVWHGDYRITRNALPELLECELVGSVGVMRVRLEKLDSRTSAESTPEHWSVQFSQW